MNRSTTANARRMQRWLGASISAAVFGLVLFPAAAASAPTLDVSFAHDASEIQLVGVAATAGQFRLEFGEGGPGVSETVDIASNASAAQVQAALNALTNVSAGGGGVSVMGNVIPGSSRYRIAFNRGPLANSDVPELRVRPGTTPLTGGLIPGQEVEIETIDEAGVSRSDERVDYRIRVRNSSPVVAGPPVVGDVLGCNGASPNKLWSPGTLNTRPAGFAFRWMRNGVVVPGETEPSYVTTEDDAGAHVQCLVSATSFDGLSKSTVASLPTSPTAVVGAAPSPLPPAPVSATVAASRPVVSPASGAVGVSRTCSTAAMNWTAGGAPVSFSFQWLRNGESIPGASSASYTPVQADDKTILQCMVVGETGTGIAPNGGRLVGVSTNSTVGAVASPPVNAVANTPNTVIDAVAPEIEIELPHGASLSETEVPGLADNFNRWSCSTRSAIEADPPTVVCANPNVSVPQAPAVEIELGIDLGASAPAETTVTARVGAFGVAPTPSNDMVVFKPLIAWDFISFRAGAYDPAGAEDTQAGGHPFVATTSFSFTLRRQAIPDQGAVSQHVPIEDTRTVVTELPKGFVGNIRAIPELCPDVNIALLPLSEGGCPVGSVVGRVVAWTHGVNLNQIPLIAMEPERGEIAQFAFGERVSGALYILRVRLRPEDGYSIAIDAPPVTRQYRLLGASAAVCAYGAVLPAGWRVTRCKQKGEGGADPANPLPFMTNIPRCSGESPITTINVDSWDNPGRFISTEALSAPMTGCELVAFTPSTSLELTGSGADSASGLRAVIEVPDDGLVDPDGISQAHLKKTVVELPEGVAVNPSAATGLEGCSDAQLGLGTDSEPACPDGSRIAAVHATTPVLEEELDGVMVLRTPSSTDPMSGGMFRMALIVRNRERGILVKLPGSATADPRTGRLVATFDENPQLPIGEVSVDVKGGQRGVLALPLDCGPVESRMTLTSWNHLNDPAVGEFETAVDQGCGERFAPQLSAGNSDNGARGEGGAYSFRFSRQDGDRWLRGLTAKLPRGLLASVAEVPLCSNAVADVGGCPAGSKIGVVDAKAGSGDPFVLEEKGEVFLTEGYKGGEFGLMVKVRPVAGPFRGEHELSPIVVRQAIHVDRATAEVTAVSDPFPLVHHGIPLRVREINVVVNRPGFMLNPSDCDPKQTAAELLSAEGATASLVDRFQVSGCAALAFKPKLTLGLSGRKQVTTGRHPGVRAKVTQQGTSEAGIEKAVVRLPKSLALDVNNAQALCEFVDGTKPDLENHCPKGSIVGRARAKTPLLKDDLVGNVYFVKNVRKDPKTGNEIRTLPMIVVALRGELSVNLKGESDTTRAGKLVNTFNQVPDAPISQFNLNIQGGRNGILAVTRTRRANINLCAKPKGQIAEADIDGHNGRRFDRDIRMKTPCTKRRVKQAKRQVSRADQAGRAAARDR